MAKRPNVPADTWENPCNAQHQQRFVNVHEDAYGLTIANKGLAEYEILSGLSLDVYITWPMEGLYEGVTTVTDVSEVDYSSPL